MEIFMKILHHGAWLVLAVILQTLILNNISFFGVHADLFLVLAASIGFLCGRVQGTVCGIIFGLIYDFFVGRIIGIDMAAFALIGFFSAVVSDRYYNNPSFYVFMLLGAAATVAAELLYMIPYIAVIGGGIKITSVIRTIGIEAVLNGILILPLIWCIKKTMELFKIKNIINYR